MTKFRFALLSIILLGLVVLAVTQSKTWKTGRVSAEPLALFQVEPTLVQPIRLWIDTDAACGATPRTDPDDCFAIVWLASHGFEIAGISTSFGNADGRVVEQTVNSLVAMMTLDGMPAVPTWKGHEAPRLPGTSITEPGVIELRIALGKGPLTILALGPLTNIAAALEGRPDLKRNVVRVVAVMGHEPGHLFHPTEGKGSGALFGHGPIFRDLNFSIDVGAAKEILAMNLPLVLIPYDAARNIVITRQDLNRLSGHREVYGKVVKTAQGWLSFWNNEVGQPGFYPFDWVAAAYIADPSLFYCAHTQALVAWEWAFWLLPRQGLVVGEPSPGSEAGANVQYCPQTRQEMHAFLLSGHIK